MELILFIVAKHRTVVFIIAEDFLDRVKESASHTTPPASILSAQEARRGHRKADLNRPKSLFHTI